MHFIYKYKSLFWSWYFILLLLLFAMIVYFTFKLPKLSGEMIDLLTTGDWELFLIVLIKMLIASLVSSILLLFSETLINKVQIKITTRLKQNLLHQINKAPLHIRERIQLSEYQTRIVEIERIEVLFSSNVFKLLIGLVVMICALIYIRGISYPGLSTV